MLVFCCGKTNLLLFGRFRKVLRLSLIRFVNDPYTLYNRLNVSGLARFRKTQKLVNQGKTQCWALFVISKATNLKRRNKTTKQFPNRRIIDSLRKHPFFLAETPPRARRNGCFRRLYYWFGVLVYNYSTFLCSNELTERFFHIFSCPWLCHCNGWAQANQWRKNFLGPST